MPGRTKWVVGLVLLSAGCGGCTLEQYRRLADLAAYRTLRSSQKEALGQPGRFEVDYRPVTGAEGKPDAPVQIGDKTITIGTGKLQKLTLNECLEIAFRNSRSFQDRKEDLYGTALALANARRSWDIPLLGGQADAEAQLDKTAEGAYAKTADGNVGPTLTQRFIHGGMLTLGYALGAATDFAGGPGSTVGSLLEATFTQPLLRGAWRGLAYEDQYRLERDFLFAVFNYERFTQTFAVDIVSRYYSVLQQRDRLENDRANIERLKQTFALTRVLAEGGQVSRIQQDQAEQGLLNAQVDLEQNTQGYRDALDQFKLLLGLPIRADLELDYPAALAALNQAGPKKIDINEPQAIAAALLARPDVLTERANVRDAARDREIAADAFYPELELTAGISAASTPTRDFWATRFDRNRRFARLTLDYDLDQTDNRDAYRRALLAEGRARRTLEAFEDGVRLEVRQAYRSLLQSRRSYELQRRSVAIAIRRTKLAALQQKEGLVPARDVLDAERDLRGAQNGLTGALVGYTNTRLRFLAQLGLLTVDEKGRLHERAEPFRFDRIQRRYQYVGSR